MSFLPIVNIMLSFLVADLIPFSVTGCVSCGSVSSPGINVIVINSSGKSGGENPPHKSIVL